MIKLENSHVSLAISEHGAEPQSLVNKQTRTEYIWGGNPTYWQRHAPILFPLSGPTKDSKIAVEGKEFVLPNNGFARDMDFSIGKVTDKTASLVLEESDASLSMYPFGFRLIADYTLNDDGFTIKTTVESKTDGMRFIYALHPAFNLAINEGADLDSYSILFSDEEKLERNIMVNKVFEKQPGGVSGKVMRLSRADLDKGPIVLNNVKSKKVTLSSSKGNHGVDILMGSLHTLVCWSPEGKKAPFVCIEPMYSFGDATRPIELKEMDGLVKLDAGDKKAFVNTISVF
jgi:galactose mutarotase-like enzyme